MKIIVKTKPGAKKAYIKEEPIGLFFAAKPSGERKFTVAVTERAMENRANDAIIAALADHFKTAKGNVRIISGARAKEKIIEIREK